MATIKFEPDNSQAYDQAPVCVKVLPGVREQLKTVANWQTLTRQFWDRLIEESQGDSP